MRKGTKNKHKMLFHGKKKKNPRKGVCLKVKHNKRICIYVRSVSITYNKLVNNIHDIMCKMSGEYEESSKRRVWDNCCGSYTHVICGSAATGVSSPRSQEDCKDFAR